MGESECEGWEDAHWANPLDAGSDYGFWLINWIRNAPPTEIEGVYQKLGNLVADGSLYVAVEHVYPLDQFKEAFKQSLKSNRSGKDPVPVSS